MLRGGPGTADSSTLQDARQKKRLSFRDPEVEGPQRNSSHPGSSAFKSKTLGRPTASARPTVAKRHSSSAEDLTLEDQKQFRAQYVENTFSNLSISDGDRRQFREFEEKETDIIDSSPTQEDYQFHVCRENREYLESWVTDTADMRGPPTEREEAMDANEHYIPEGSPPQETVHWSSSEQHQIQMLRYQLEQQHQQTQMALHQIQLLHDQLSAESEARRKAQEQNNELMNQNTELLNHMEKLFLQIEELEKQMQQLEQEKRGRRTVPNPRSPVPSLRQPMSYTAHRRQSTEQALQSRLLNTTPKNAEPDKAAVPIRSSYTAARRSSLTLAKPQATTPRPATSENRAPQYTQLSTARKTAAGSSKSCSAQSKNVETGNKPIDSLRIGDTSPPAATTKSSPFNSLWKSRSSDMQSSAEKSSATATDRSRAGSVSSYGKKQQESSTAKGSLFSGGSALSVTGAKSKKYSSSTSDLYLSTAQSKPTLSIEEPASPKVRNAVSNLSINSTSTGSRLPRYQPYTGWQRRTSLTSDNEPSSGSGKDPYKNISSLFKR